MSDHIHQKIKSEICKNKEQRRGGISFHYSSNERLITKLKDLSKKHQLRKEL
jgi:hypothetical protein